MAFLARRGGVEYAEEVQGIYALGLPASLAAKAYGDRPPLVLAVKLDGKLNKWPGDAEAPCILVSSELCAESGALEYPLHLL
jgi:hypothetical protein